MRLRILFLFILVFVFQVRANVDSKGALKTELKDQTFKATLDEGFHFNEKAPNALTVDDQTIKPTKLLPRESEFKNLPKSWSSGRAALYVCDDALTFCEPHFIELTGTVGKSPVEKSLNVFQSPNPRRGKVNSHGFIQDDFNKALSLAEKQKQLVLIDFSARWCPGCIRLETETFDTPAFKKMTKDFVKLKIDVDRFENNFLSEKFNVKNIPTLLVLSANQEEIDRVVDFQPNDILESFFSSIKANPTTMAELKAKAGGGGKDPNAALVLGKRFFTANRFKESVEILSQIKPAPPEYWGSRVGAAAQEYKKDPTTITAYAKTLREAIQAEPNTSRSIAWRTDLVGLVGIKRRSS
jgi:thiol-disulfide isomerase/thioredoxin